MTSKIKIALNKAAALAKKEPFFVVTLLLTVVLSFFSRPHISAVHWNVISTLFSLMIICAAFQKCKLLTSLASAALNKFKTPRRLGFAMIFTAGGLAMFVTNDVALLTVVPLTLIMAQVSGEDPFMLIIFETIAANILSALTPFGNPQNLYLYSFFKIPPEKFFEMMIPFCLFGTALLCAANFFFNKGGTYKTQKHKFEICNGRLLAGASAAFIANILSVIGFIDYRIALVFTLITFLIIAPKLILKADFFLLMTFVLFFLFTDSVTQIPPLRNLFTHALNSRLAVLIASAGLSQIISNVPAAVLVSGFTNNYREILYGVSAGGLGTLVASLASLISYRFYVRSYKSGRYLKAFFALNFGILIIMTAAVSITEII